MKVSNRPGEGIVRISGLNFLNNDAVNLLSAVLTALATGLAASRLKLFLGRGGRATNVLY